MTMSKDAIDALHDVHTATNDVLKGYREMSARAEPEIQSVIRRLIDMHERHAAEQEAELVHLRDAGTDDSSLQGTVNKVVVMVRDWVSDLDRDALPAVRDGEKSLRDKYDKALQDGRVSEHATVGTLLKTQVAAITSEIARLPKD
jgi:dTDP-glucose pyrophosphorylase